MNILIVEDDNLKSNQIEECLISNFSNIAINTAKSYHSGIDAIERQNYDLILLDMSMPTFDDSTDSHRSFAGKEILSEMERLEIEVKTLVVTGFGVFGDGSDKIDAKKLDESLMYEFPNVYLGMIRYDMAYSDWKTELIDRITKIAKE